MSETVFKTKNENVESQEVLPEGKESSQGEIIDLDLPYSEDPDFITDYFKLGTEWKDHDASFYPEIDTINEYITSKIDSGEIANTPTAVKELLKGMERTNSLTKEERQVVKLEVLANYCEFLMKNDKLKSNLRRYA